MEGWNVLFHIPKNTGMKAFLTLFKRSKETLRYVTPVRTVLSLKMPFISENYFFFFKYSSPTGRWFFVSDAI